MKGSIQAKHDTISFRKRGSIVVVSGEKELTTVQNEIEMFEKTKEKNRERMSKRNRMKHERDRKRDRKDQT